MTSEMKLSEETASVNSWHYLLNDTNASADMHTSPPPRSPPPDAPCPSYLYFCFLALTGTLVFAMSSII